MRKSSPVVVLLITACLLVLVFVAYVWFSVPSAPVVVLPNPNAYPQFLESGGQIVGAPDDVSNSDVDTLSRYLAANSAVLSKIRRAMQLECMVPIEYTKDYQRRVVDDVGPLKTVGRLLWSDARLAELEGRADEAAEKYAEVIRFSQKVSNGGLLVHLQSGVAYERVGLQGLLKLAPALSKEQKAAISKELASINRGALTVKECMTREKALASAVHGRFMVFIMSRGSGADAGEEQTQKLLKEMESAREEVIKAFAE